MIHFFGEVAIKVFAVQTSNALSQEDTKKLVWLFGNQPQINAASLDAFFIGPRAAMITPWSTNATEITQNMGISGIQRMEEFIAVSKDFSDFDPMISQKYAALTQDIYTIDIQPEAILDIDDIAAYNQQEGLALNEEEVDYLNQLSTKMGRKLTDSEVFGFSQVNSEHCRHKIFNGTFIIDGEEKPTSLFKLIKKTSKEHPNDIVSAYKDNVAFVKGPNVIQFAPKTADKPDYYHEEAFDSVISLKAETHNFPTTVEPFNGAATGSGGEIRDRLAGGKGSLPLAGTAVYMTAYSRLTENRAWEKGMPERPWRYQTPMDILIKASNGASDFGNKFGQPLIAGSVLTFEHQEAAVSSGGDDKEVATGQDQTLGRRIAYDKVIMQAGGIGYGKAEQALKDTPETGDKIIILGGDNYRIGMGGAAVSSADTGEFSSAIELNAVQRSNPEMQKRAANAIRGMVESDVNAIVSIHDHGAGGHLNCLSELVEETGGKIDLDQLPIGDPTLSAKEIIGNESQERMGLVIGKEDAALLARIAERERSPMYSVGEVTGDDRFTFVSQTTDEKPMDVNLSDIFGSSPKTILTDTTLQLPLNNVGVMALDFKGKEGIATSIGHSPISGLIDPSAGSKNSIAEALTNIIWAPLKDSLQSVSLSANWMWPCKNKGEDARLYKAVEAISEFSIALGINVPTGKDSLSMKQKYKDGDVISPGTVVISAAANCNDITKVVEPVLQKKEGPIYYINLSKDSYKLGGSSFCQILNAVGSKAPTIKDAVYFKTAFNAIQKVIKNRQLTAGHDIASGGLITTLLEMCFADVNLGAEIDLSSIFKKIGKVVLGNELIIKNGGIEMGLNISSLRDTWFKTSYLLDTKQTAKGLAKERFENYKAQPLTYTFPKTFTGQLPSNATSSAGSRPKAAILREKGSNSEREMANAMFLAGFDVKDVHMTDLISGRETLEDIQFLGAVGGFSNSDVLGSAKGWAGAIKYNEKANKVIKNFFARPDTLSIGICNGCQLFMELDLINPDHKEHGKMTYNDSLKHESNFISVNVQENNSVMLSTLAGTTLGVWISHGEGKFSLPLSEANYDIVAKYGYEAYPANPNGSDFNTAMLCDRTGRHLVTMPHIERSTFPWNWAHYPAGRKDDASPWLEAFVNARKWVKKNSTS